MRTLTVVTVGLVAVRCSGFVSTGPSQLLNHGNRIARPTSLQALSRSTTADVKTGHPLHSRGNGMFQVKRVPTKTTTAITITTNTRSPRVGDAMTRTSSALNALSGAGSEDGQEEKDKSSLRRNVLLAVWLPLVLYVACSSQPWSPAPVSNNAEDLELVKHLYDGGEGGNAIFSSIFNSLGAIPAIYASTLIGGGAFKTGKQPVPPQPFVFGAFAAGFFALGPYLALRNYSVEGETEELSRLEKGLTSNFTGILLLALSVYNYAIGIPALFDPAAVQGYADLFHSSLLVHVSTLDFIILAICFVDPLREDMKRRGFSLDPAKVALFSIPVVGPALWLVVRPPVATGE